MAASKGPAQATLAALGTGPAVQELCCAGCKRSALQTAVLFCRPPDACRRRRQLRRHARRRQRPARPRWSRPSASACCARRGTSGATCQRGLCRWGLGAAGCRAHAGGMRVCLSEMHLAGAASRRNQQQQAIQLLFMSAELGGVESHGQQPPAATAAGLTALCSSVCSRHAGSAHGADWCLACAVRASTYCS